MATPRPTSNDKHAVPSPNLPESTFAKLLQLVRTVQTGMQYIDQSHGLSGSQLWAVWQISAQPGLKVSELAEAMHIHHSTASNLLDKLEKRELLRRERQTDDSRVVRLHLTPAGKTIVKDIPGPLQGRLRGALKAVPSEVLAGLYQGLTAVLDSMSAAPSAPPLSDSAHLPADNQGAV